MPNPEWYIQDAIQRLKTMEAAAHDFGFDRVVASLATIRTQLQVALGMMERTDG